MAYKPAEIEPRWQRYWEEHRSFRTGDHPELPKFYVLDMFPYPSGDGLHLGHVEGYAASDIAARYKRMKGFDVLHPMGWDAYGLPAEQYAIEQGVHPETSTRQNIENFRKQLKLLGLSYDWEREFATCDPDFCKWTQWIFLKLLENDLAYRMEVPVNWCPALGTVLSNDEVIDGKSERGGHEVIRKPMAQWMLRITKYAERLLDGLETTELPDSIKAMQRERIGRSEGADAVFPIDGLEEGLEIFTTRPDTLFGATFCVLAPEHPLVDAVTTEDRRATVEQYQAESARKSDMDRAGPEAGKTGVFTGRHAVNPVNGQAVPIWIADYVLMGYGTGAIMCVPGHDQRDWEFATKFELPIVEVISGGNISEHAYEGEGTMVNSGFLDGTYSQDAIRATIDWLEERNVGKGAVRYRLRDWIFARQRYWGEPVPVVHDEDNGIHPLREDQLPLELPPLDDFKPPGTGESPLARVSDWVNTTVPGTQQPARRETDTMPRAAASSWYFLRFIDPGNGQVFCDPALARRWMPVDLYIGGAEHAVGHLIYSRFWTKFLYDLGVCPVDEPYVKLVNQGMILGEDHRKMSKRYGNTINPTDVVAEYGADALRIYEMFMGPLEVDKPWATGGMDGVWRFLNRTWRLFFDEDDRLHASVQDVEASDEVNRILHKTIDKVDQDTENLRFNTAISQMMIFVNEVGQQETRPRSVMERFLLLLAPYAPHMAEEIWQRLGHGQSLIREPFPEADPRWLVEDVIEVPVQINGKVRERLRVPAVISEDEIRELALASDRVQKFIADKQVIKFIYVPGKIVTIVAK